MKVIVEIPDGKLELTPDDENAGHLYLSHFERSYVKGQEQYKEPTEMWGLDANELTRALRPFLKD